MKALIKREAKLGIWMGDVDKPSISANQVLIKIKKTAICGTDLHIYKWDDWAQKTIPVPMHVGHEFMGHIVELGTDVPKNLKIGDRVSGEGHLICGICRNCRSGKFHLCTNTYGIGVNKPGAFAEYLALPAFNVFKLPDYISDDIASMLDPFGNAVHTALTFDVIGEDVLITGAGPIGAIACAICKKIGARNVVIIDINQYRLDLATKLGADCAINISDCHSVKDITAKIKKAMQQLDIKEGFDIGLEMSGVDNSIHALIDLMMHGGRIAMLGINGSKDVVFDWNQIVFKSLTLQGVYGRKMFDTWYRMASLIKSGLDVTNIITHVLPIKEYETGFELMQHGKCGKIILDWTNI